MPSQTDLAGLVAVDPGRVQLRLDQLGKDARVVQRIVVPLAQAAAGQLTPGQTYTVQPGNNLWQISRRAYGIGTRLMSFSWIPGTGFSVAAATLVGQSLGARQPEEAARAGWRAARFALVVFHGSKVFPGFVGAR